MDVDKEYCELRMTGFARDSWAAHIATAFHCADGLETKQDLSKPSNAYTLLPSREIPRGGD